MIIEAEKCLLPVVANALNELTSTVARTCLFDKITTLLELWQSYKKCVKAENKAWALVHEAKCQAKLTEAEKMKDKKMIRKWKAAFKRPKQLKATIFGNNFLLFFMSRRVHHLFYLDSAFSLTSPAPLGAPVDWKTKRNDGGWFAKHHLGWDSATKRQNKSTKNYVLATVAINSTKEHLASWKSHFQEVSHFFVIRPSSWYFSHFPPTFCKIRDNQEITKNFGSIFFGGYTSRKFGKISPLVKNWGIVAKIPQIFEIQKKNQK